MNRARLAQSRTPQINKLLNIDSGEYDLTNPADFHDWVLEDKGGYLPTLDIQVLAALNGLWLDKYGDPKRISNMATQYICNTINYINRNPEFRLGSRDYSTRALYSELSTREEAEVIQCRAQVLRRELKQQVRR